MSELLSRLKPRYEKDDKWRTAWNALANKHDHNKPRLQTTQEYIENRAVIANGRIAALMDEFDQATEHRRK